MATDAEALPFGSVRASRISVRIKAARTEQVALSTARQDATKYDATPPAELKAGVAQAEQSRRAHTIDSSHHSEVPYKSCTADAPC